MNPIRFSVRSSSRSFPVALVFSWFAAIVAHADHDPAPEQDIQSRWSTFVRGGYVNQFDADLDQGGGLAVDRLFIQAGVRYRPDRNRSVALAVGYGYDSYDFSGTAGFAALRPWKSIATLRVSVPLRYRPGEDWTLFAAPTVRSAAERGASLGDGVSGGVLVGARHRFSPRLTLGPGVGVMTRIEDDTSVFPVLLVNWHITERLSLDTGRGLAASAGPGLFLTWRADNQWKYFLGTRYETLRFRLDGQGVAPDGVGEDRALPVFLGATYPVTPFGELSVLGGVQWKGELRLDDEKGNRISDDDRDATAFAGFYLRARF